MHVYVCSNDGGLVEERPVEARPWNEARVSQMWRQRERERECLKQRQRRSEAIDIKISVLHTWVVLLTFT